MSIKWLTYKFLEYGDKEAIIWQNEIYSYNWLYNKLQEWTKLIDKMGGLRGQVVAIEGDYSPSICVLMLALIENKNIIVPLSSASDENKKEYICIANVDISFIFDRDGTWITQKYNQNEKNELTRKLIDAEEPGLVLFSSGSTGKSKGAIHNFNKLIERYKKPRKTLRTLVFLLIDHIGGINTLFNILSNGGTMIIPESKNTTCICKTIEKYKVELLPTSPTFINLLLISEEYKNYDLSSLKLITYGTEPMLESTLNNANNVFPNAKFKQTYGLSELGIMGTKSESNDSLWMKLGGDGFEVKVMDGVLWIKSETAMLGYLNAPNPFDEEGWFNTSDLVIQKGEYFKVLGRTSEIINVGGQKVYPAEVESVLLEIDNIRDVIVMGEKNPILGNIVTAKVNLVESENIMSLKKRIRQYCSKRLESFKIPVKIDIVDNDLFSSRFKRMRKS